VLGTVLMILGTVALGAYLTGTRDARLALPGMVLAVTGQILFTVSAAPARSKAPSTASSN
jgi:hypothetical protein